MTWKTRERKIFNRLVNRLKAAPIYRLGGFTIIDADIIFICGNINNTALESKSLRERSFSLHISEGEIKTSGDFDSFYNPSLTLDILFETYRSKVNQLVCNALDEIAESWKARLIELGENDKLLFRYFDADTNEWSLEFLNTNIPVSAISSKVADVKFFIPEIPNRQNDIRVKNITHATR